MKNPSSLRRSALLPLILLLTSLSLLPQPLAAQPGGEGCGGEGDEATGLALFSDEHEGRLDAPLLDTAVEIHVTGLIARTAVTQRFWNATAAWVEGIYTFPLPENAAVDTLRMKIGERTIEGEIREKEEARKVYDEAKAEGQKASLVEQHRPNVFTTSVANLGPDEVVEISLEYQQELAYVDGTFTLRFPMVVAARYEAGGQPLGDLPQPPLAERKVNPVSLAIDLEPGFPLANLSSSTHAITSREFAPRRFRVELASEVVPADRDFVLSWTPARGEAPSYGIFTQEVAGETFALVMMLPPAEDSGPSLPREVIYVIDTSGSMSGSSMVQARAALVAGLGRLTPGDWFNVIEFNSVMRKLFPVSVLASADNIETAQRFVTSLSAGGGTEMLPALEAALNGPAASQANVRQVVFITDGEVTDEEELFAAIERSLGASRLFTVGIGPAPNTYFMAEAAARGRGTHTLISSTSEVSARMGELFVKLERPVATDLALTLTDPTAEVIPERLPDLYQGEPLVVAVRARELGQSLRLSARSEGQPKTLEVEAVGSSEHAGIDKLWARRKLGALERELALGGDEAAIRPAMVELALAHHLVSRFTSLVAVETTPSRPAGERALARIVPVNAPDDAGELPAGGTRARLVVLIGLLLLLSAMVVRWRPIATT